MRRTLALAAVAGASVAIAVVMGEYVLTLWTALAAGAVVGFLLPEIVLVFDEWRGVVPAVFTGVCGASALAWAAWIEAGRGVAPIRATAWLGVAVAAGLGAGRLWPRGSGPEVHLADGDAAVRPEIGDPDEHGGAGPTV